jgi:hypothetical protein
MIIGTRVFLSRNFEHLRQTKDLAQSGIKGRASPELQRLRKNSLLGRSGLSPGQPPSKPIGLQAPRYAFPVHASAKFKEIHTSGPEGQETC